MAGGEKNGQGMSAEKRKLLASEEDDDEVPYKKIKYEKPRSVGHKELGLIPRWAYWVKH